uniref:MMS19 nucleotide excision repair protein n=1 Tax=Trypanosoma congolense (strain IL3000) TaxID=1068625 RepID=F9W9S3_TRYCI|nr:unnamed protein product [Trypanosoma congolense IL3000]
MLTEEEIEVLLRSVFSEGRNCDDELLMKLRQIPLLSLTRAMNAYLTCEEHVVTAVRVLGLATHGREDRTAEEVEVMLHFFTDKLSSLQTLEVAIEAIALLTGDLSSKGPCTYDVFTALLSKFLQSTSLQALPTNIRRLGYDVLCFMVTRETAQWFSTPFLEAVLRSLDEEGEPELVLRALGLHQVIATYASESVMRPLLYEYFESISSYFPVVFSEIPGCKVTRADLQRALSTCMTHPVYSDPCIKFLLSRMSSPSAVVKQESVELLLDIISPASRHITERLCQHIASVIGHIRNEVVRAVTFGSTHSDAYVKDCLRLLGFVSKRAGDSALCSTHSWVEPMTSGALASLSSGPSVCSAYATMFYHLVSADVHCGVSIASHFLPQLLDGVQSSGSESDGAVLIISAILTGLCDAESSSENFSGLQLQDAVKECLEPVRGSLFQLAETLATSLHVAEVASVCVRCEFLATLMVLAAWLRPWLCDDTALFVCRKLIALSVSRDDEAASNIVKHISRIGRVEGGMLHDALLSMSGNVEPTVAGVLTLYKGLMNSSASMAFMATKSLLELPEALFKTSPADKDVFSLCRYGVSTHGGFSAEDVRCLVMLASRRNSFDSFCYLLDLLPMLPVTLIPSMLHEVGNGRCGVVAIAILSCFSDDVLGVSKNVDEWVTDLLSVVHAAPVSVLGMQGVSAMCARVPHVSRIFLERSEKLCLPTQLAVYAATARGLLCAEDAATGEVCKITEWITSSISSEWAVSCHKDILSAAFFVSRARGECRAITLLQPLVHGVVRGALPISLELLGVVVRLVREEPFTHVLEWNDVLEFARIISKRPLGGDFVDWFVELLSLALSHIGSKELLVNPFLGD